MYISKTLFLNFTICYSLWIFTTYIFHKVYLDEDNIFSPVKVLVPQSYPSIVLGDNVISNRPCSIYQYQGSVTHTKIKSVRQSK